MLGKQNKLLQWFLILFVTVSFIFVYYNAFVVSQKTGRGHHQIYKAAEAAVKSYLQTPTVSTITYTSSPIFYDENGCVIGCYIDLSDTSGAKRRTWLNVLLQREERIWKGTIIKAISNQPIVNENIKPAPWDLLFKSAKKER